MAGSLILVDSDTANNSASISLTGIDSTYNVYVCQLIGIKPASDGNFFMRVTTGGTPDSDSEYDTASRVFKANTGYGTTSDTDEAQWRINSTVGSDTNEEANHTIWLFNFNNSSEYSFYTNESQKLNASGNLEGYQGGGNHTVAEANDGVNFFFTSGNIVSGEFKMYGLKK